MTSKFKIFMSSRKSLLLAFSNFKLMKHAHTSFRIFSAVSGRSSILKNINKTLIGTPLTKREMSQAKAVVGEYNISYNKVGTGKHPLLLLPGALGTGKGDFGPQLSGLDPDVFTVIAWDPPGYGDSRPPDRTWPANFFQRDADCAAALMAGLGYDKYSMVGWSDGGITGLIMAAQHTKNIDRFVLFGANAFFGDEDMELFSKVKDVTNWSARMREPLEKVYGVEGFRRLWQEWNDAVEWYMKNRDGDVCKLMLKDIICPTLIIHGVKDAMIAPIHPVYLRENISNAKYYEFADGKHNLHFKYANEFNKIVTDFLIDSPHSSL